MSAPLNAVTHVMDLIRVRFGLDFGGMRHPVLLEGLARLAPDVDAAAHALIRADRGRFADFVGTLTNSETYFFRHAEQFSALAALLQRQWLDRPPVTFRAWCAGCASGEEPLTVSAVIEDVCALVPARPVATVLATDISPSALGLAQRASYSEWSFRGVLQDQRTRHFIRDGAAYRPRASLRERITFLRHNLLDEPPEPTPFDLVICRNVLIYFDAPRFELAMNRLTLAVAPGGILVLGPVESAAAKLPGFEVLHPGACVVYRKRLAGFDAPVETRPSRPIAPRRVAPPAPATERRPGPVPTIAPPPGPELSAQVAEARALADQGQLEQARALAGALRFAHGDLGELRILSALIHLEEGNRAAAAAELEAAISADADLAMAHYLLGVIHDGEGTRAQAESRYRKALHAIGDAAPHALVPGGGTLTVSELISTLTYVLGLTPEVAL